ncbi:MAG: glycosyltransferase family 4 protein [Butyrivibrio sp.]|jgi:glycosyltransferase involved in cell wall biosynthesis|nr:glycosyltransferase family 4 protein [Butyrivibrio sp.]
MKILMVNKFLYPNGGSETYFLQVGNQLQKMGHEVEYFGMEHEGRVVGNHVESYTESMEFHSNRLKALTYPLKIIYSGEARKKIRLVLEDFKPNVVHLNNINFQLTPSIIDEIHKFDPQIRIVYTAHDSQWVCPDHLMRIPSSGELCQKCIDGNYRYCIQNRCIHNSVGRSILGAFEGWFYQKKRTYTLVDKVICPSEFMNKVLSHNPDLKSRTVTIHNYVNQMQSMKPERSSVEKYVLYFGRFDEEKGIHTLLKVCRQLPEVSFVFAGKGTYEQEVNEVRNIRNAGFLSGTELYSLIQNAAFTVFPSECYENCPFSVMESIVYGTPVIASDLGGTPELIENHKTGELFAAGDFAELKMKIENLWYDEEKCKSYQMQCRNILNGKNSRFDTLESYCKKLIEIYEMER